MSKDSFGECHIVSTMTGISTDGGRFNTQVRLKGDPTKSVVSWWVCMTVTEVGGGAMRNFKCEVLYYDSFTFM